MKTPKTSKWVLQHRALLKEILEHQIANLESDNEFYTCYTYKPGEMPPWVAKAKALLQNAGMEAERNDVLARLVGRFSKRAKMNGELEASFGAQKNHVEALKCSVRRDAWEHATEMVERERLSNSKKKDCRMDKAGLWSGEIQ